MSPALYCIAAGQSGSGSKQQGKEQAHEDAPRYTATVIDVQPEIAASSRWECCLFIVPQVCLALLQDKLPHSACQYMSCQIIYWLATA